MNKPTGWEEAKAITGEFQSLPAGGYICQIVKAEVAISRKGAEMLKIAFDIADGEYLGYFRDRYENNAKQHDDAKWPAGGVYYQLTGGDSVGRFKGLIATIEESNAGYTWDWNEKSLTGKLFGGKFREEEYIGTNDGKIHSSVKCINILPAEGITEIPVPEKKTVDGANSAYGNGNTFSTNVSSEEIPF